MLSYCKCDTESIMQKLQKDWQWKIMLSSKCIMCNSKTSRIIEKIEVSGLLNKLGIKAPLKMYSYVCDNFGQVKAHWKLWKMIFTSL